MPTTFTPEDVRLLGYTNAAVKDTDPGYEIVDATLSAGLEEVSSRFIYLKARCTVDTANRVARTWQNSDHRTYVVKAPSLSIQDPRLRRIFGATANVFSHDDLVWRVLESSFGDYLHHTQDDVPIEEHFISPRLGSMDSTGDVVSRLISYLSGRSPSTDDGTLWVLSAGAGVGKTTLSRHLMHRLVSTIRVTRTIPIYVEAQHWKKLLNTTSLEGLWDVIDNSLRVFSAPHIQLTETLFRHALRQGYFCFIFDGFDELCGGQTTQFEPGSVLEELNDVVAESEARVLLTTRTLFWEAKIGQVPKNVEVMLLEPFNTQQAKGYFNKAFGQGGPQRRAANQLYSTMLSQATPPQHTGSVRDQFVNLPLCVRMVADYVSRGGSSVTAIPGEPILQSFLTGICEREINRQGLVSSAKEQLTSFQDMALSYEGASPVFSIDDLAATPGGFSEEDVGKAFDHALLAKAEPEERDVFSFRYDFIAPFLRASAINRWLHGQTPKIDDLPQLLIESLILESDGKGEILEQLLNFVREADLGRVMEMGALAASAVRKGYLESFFFHVAQSVVPVQGGITRSERAELLLRAMATTPAADLPRKRVEGWGFRGPMNRLDFRKVVFSGCRFSDISFRHCMADDRTRFVDCLFEGDQDFEGPVAGWRRVKFERCRFVFPADMIWERLIDRSLGDKATRARHMLSVGLRKFWYHGTVRGSLREAHWKKGQLTQTGKAADMLLSTMMSEGLVDKIAISGVHEGGLALDRSSIGDVRNYMDNNQLSGKVEAVYHRLLSEWS